MKDRLNWEKICEEIQKRSLESTPMTCKNTKELKTLIFKCLNKANDERILKTKKEKIHSFLKLVKSEDKGKGVWEILGGGKNFKRIQDSTKFNYFERVDGCWFDFAITVDETQKPAEIIGFDFEIRFPESYQPRFFRFDLNLPNHDNEIRGIRFHIHPGNDDFMIHSPPINPLEILHLFIYGLPLSKKPRS